jgi:peptidoglycan/LPS O-acetylase OafA/YrhL
MEMAAGEMKSTNRELKLLNLVSILVAVGFIAFAVLNALFSPQLMTTDNLFVTVVCLVMALMFVAGPVLQLKSEGKLPIPFQKRLARRAAAKEMAASNPPLLDAKGRAVPPDVRSMMTQMKQKR